MHTEEEAAKLWCPHVRHSNDQEAAANCTGPKRIGNVPEDVWNTCIASKCSQWRWVMVEYVAEQVKIEPEDPINKSHFFSGHALPHVEPYPEIRVKQSNKGFCGLAGKP
jgi:hypothetical protein